MTRQKYISPSVELSSCFPDGGLLQKISMFAGCSVVEFRYDGLTDFDGIDVDSITDWYSEE